MAKYLLIFLLFGCTTTIVQNYSEDIPDNILAWSEANVFRVDTSRGKGTAFFIDNRLAITNCHVVEHSDPVVGIVLRNNNLALDVEVIECDKETDLALLRYNGNTDLNLMPTKISPSPKKGRLVYAAGYSFGAEKLIVKGHWMVVTEKSDPLVRVTIHTVGGDSGSPVLLPTGEIVGVRSGNTRTGHGSFQMIHSFYAYIIDSTRLSKFIRRLT